MITSYTGISGSRIAYFAAAEIRQKRKALIVVSSERAGRRLKDDLAFFVPEAEFILVPEEEDFRILYDARDRGGLSERIRALDALVSDEESGYKVVIAPVSALLRKTCTKERYREGVFKIAMGDVVDPVQLRRRLVMSGYVNSAVCEGSGEFSHRGDIVDIFAPSMANPVRIEFWGDEVDSIRTFEADSQRSIENLDAVRISPAAELVPDDEELRDALTRIDDERIKEIFESRQDIQIYSEYMEFFDVETACMYDYAGDAPVILCDPQRITDELYEKIESKDLYPIYKQNNVIVYTPFQDTSKGIDRPDHVFNVHCRQPASFNGNMEFFIDEIRRLDKAGFRITVVSSSAERGDRIREYLAIDDCNVGIDYRIGQLSSGMILDDYKECYIAESDIFADSRRKPARRKKKKNDISFSDLKAGDFVVHETHGIGKFCGIKTITAAGMTRDYLEIRYAGTDVLYIPTEQLDIIQKYIGSRGENPNLSRLSGGTWKRTREKARNAIMKIADDLVKLYAEREAAGGYAFPKDGLWQKEFDEEFPYTETDDQLKAIEEIKEDMQKPVPMDRLLLGDVGFGKTEVAARAVFKCISDGKQAVFLAPTTLLVSQHYHNMLERFDHYPFEIRMLSRFRTEAQQNETIRELKKGTVDFVIGTHRLLSDDVKFKDLGLVIIDEEQRFGVKHKEKLKQLRSSVDVLTLSATPIPRTLNMSLTGIKDISTIEEPPGDRYPVQTFVAPEDDELLRMAISRELSRGGQAYVVSNRVKGLREIADRIEELVPEAVTVVGHGRMSETELENAMLDFVEQRANVFVATTIIENGIDIANANTMIIINSDQLGLSQLYQLRGRVGRSSRIAYAYLTYKPQKVLTEIAEKRLQAIREFTEFGSGFKVAMRDLELRGAGNILGEAQSGHIEGIGYELYCKEIDRAVRKLKGEDIIESAAEITIEINEPANIPASYIEDQTLRLQAYKKIAAITCEDDAEDLIEELIDRFGDIPEDTVNLIRISEIRALSALLGIEKLEQLQNRTVISFAQENRVSPYMVVMAKDEFKDALTILSGSNTGLSLFTGGKQRLNKLHSLMRTLYRVYNEEKSQNAC